MRLYTGMLQLGNPLVSDAKPPYESVNAEDLSFFPAEGENGEADLASRAAFPVRFKPVRQRRSGTRFR
jgi:hypothetical protein